MLLELVLCVTGKMLKLPNASHGPKAAPDLTSSRKTAPFLPFTPALTRGTPTIITPTLTPPPSSQPRAARPGTALIRQQIPH